MSGDPTLKSAETFFIIIPIINIYQINTSAFFKKQKKKNENIIVLAFFSFPIYLCYST